MRVEWQAGSLSEWQADAILFFAFENTDEPLSGLKRWMEAGGAWLKQSVAFRDFQGKPQQVAVAYDPAGGKIPRVICVGLGPADKFDLDKLRGAAAAALRKCRELRIERAALPLAALEGLPVALERALEETLIAGLSGLYRYVELKTRDVEPNAAPNVIALVTETEPDDHLRSVPVSVEAVVSGITLTRDLVSAPANHATPSFMARTAQRLAETHGFKLQIIDLEMAQTLGMGAFVAVAQGSKEPACFIVLEHAPPGVEEEAPLVLIGKGITFDTGGISIKPGANMEAMKQDMAGAGAVLGVFEALGKLGVKRRVVGLLPCTENMPDGKAYKPGDVVRTLAGLTVEVISTDAEGRMVLCDAIAYALRFQPAMIIDVATLTGACIVALGNQTAAVLTNRDSLAQEIQEIGAQVGERYWPLPLWEIYFDHIKSDVADFKNVGERTAGTIVGGIFLKQFVPETVPWAHLDIAGTAWTDKDLGFTPKGPTGFSVRLLLELTKKRIRTDKDG